MITEIERLRMDVDTLTTTNKELKREVDQLFAANQQMAHLLSQTFRNIGMRLERLEKVLAELVKDEPMVKL